MAEQVGERAEPSEALRGLYERVERGMAWLADNDPGGAYHLWFISRILPVSPMPGQGDERRAGYERYYRNRTVFERLWREMENREKLEGIGP